MLLDKNSIIYIIYIYIILVNKIIDQSNKQKKNYYPMDNLGQNTNALEKYKRHVVFLVYQ